MLKSDIKYSLVTEERDSVWSLRDKYKDTVIIWIYTSRDKETKIATYFYLIECNGHKKLSTRNIYGISLNQAMIQGMIDAMSNLDPSFISGNKKVSFITSRHVGFQGAIQGKGKNASSIQLIFDLALKKEYDITEVYCKGGEILIAMYLEYHDTSGEISRAYERQEGEKNVRREAAEASYEMCLGKVISLLKKNNVEQKIINEVQQIRPYNN